MIIISLIKYETNMQKCYNEKDLIRQSIELLWIVTTPLGGGPAEIQTDAGGRRAKLGGGKRRVKTSFLNILALNY